MGRDSTQKYGIQELYRPIDVEPEVDVVAVHGLDGGARSTWTSRKRDVCWLDHPDFLPGYVKSARVLVWGYNASSSSRVGGKPSRNRIHHHAHTLVANLSDNRRISGMARKPIIFLCHGLGGLIVKRALSYSHMRTAPEVSREHGIFSNTYGIVFFGTPHSGCEKAYLRRKALASFLGGISLFSCFKRPSLAPHPDLVSALAKDSETLQNITDYFVPLMRNFHISFFWEQRAANLGVGPRGYVVSIESAAPACEHVERAGIDADHYGMVRFEDPAVQGFQAVACALLRYCERAPGVVRRRQAHAAEVMGCERRRLGVEVLDGIPEVLPGGPVTAGVSKMEETSKVEGVLASQLQSGTVGQEGAE